MPTPPLSQPAVPFAVQPPPLPIGVVQRGAPDLVRHPPPPAFGEAPPKTIGEMQAHVNKSAAAFAGVLAASNAAADLDHQDKQGTNKPVADKPVTDKNPAEKEEGESIEVIWYEPSYVARMRKHPQWATFFQPPAKAAPVQRGQAPAPPPSAESIEEATSADIFTMLSKADPVREQDLVPGRKGGTNHDAGLYLLRGTISFPLDEIEMLKATARAAAPLASSDKKLKEVLDRVDEVMKMPLEGAPEVVQSFVVRVREAWLNANHLLPADYLVTHTERALLNQRQYQKRELLDDEWIRSLYHSAPDAVPIPAYVPAKLAKRLPLFRQFSARLVVEALSPQDMYESHPLALRVVALARSLMPREPSTAMRSRR